MSSPEDPPAFGGGSPRVSRNQYPIARECAPLGALTMKATRDLVAWVERYPGAFESALALPVAMTNSFATPWLGARGLRLCCRAGMWFFGIDDVTDNDVDGRRLTEAEAEAIPDTYAGIAAGRAPDPDDLLGVALAELRDELASRPLFPAMRDLWLQSLRRALDDMVFTRRQAIAIASGAAPPSAEVYLEHYESMGSAWVRLVQWIDTEGPSVLTHLDVLMPALREAILALRLANDIHCYEREQQEAYALNILMLGVSREAALQMMESHARRCEQLLEPLIEASFGPAVGLVRLVHWVLAFYAVTDYRTGVPAPLVAPSREGSGGRR
jgi:hypothetical protein